MNKQYAWLALCLIVSILLIVLLLERIQSEASRLKIIMAATFVIWTLINTRAAWMKLTALR